MTLTGHLPSACGRCHLASMARLPGRRLVSGEVVVVQISRGWSGRVKPESTRNATGQYDPSIMSEPVKTMTDPAQFDTVIFDVIGTVVDEHGSVLAETRAVLAGNGIQDDSLSTQLAAEWTDQLDLAVGDIAAGRAAWESNDSLRRRTLDAAIDTLPTLRIDRPGRDRLASVGHRLRPWPDSAQALRDLQARFTVVALSNGDLRQLADLSAFGGLSWHCVLSGSMVHSVKPDPKVYRLALEELQLDPRRSLLIACHPWDLKAAALQGFRTAFVQRPNEARPADGDRFDLMGTDLAHVVRQLEVTSDRSHEHGERSRYPVDGQRLHQQ
jgi:2-haloacid dehalogenase